MSESQDRLPRRSMLSRLGLGIAAVGAVGTTRAEAQAGAQFQPAHHPEDDWLDQAKAGHRLVIDSTTPEGGGAALAYANNFLIANKSGYRLDPPALGVVIVLRHFSTPVAYKDAIWAKYGAI